MRITLRIFLVFVCLFMSDVATAKGNSSFNSEISHVAGGAVAAGALVAISDYYWPEIDRAWVGFGISSVVGTLAELDQYIRDDNSAKEALLDAGSHILGSAIGAYITDQYFLRPVVHLDAGKGTYVGISASFRF
ncbi:hypothetical protein HWQ46_15125 [Shewanella sp. D64]|uniref:hypothetical protein n=1 Tax=unclassified Shewanella TaxID=196818 RepID=UPI0022BA498C|nr:MULTISPECIES: hypothetical protein [unclassified Shewanella]MEC4726883.1 hypothetical protein [Shewanella sp. D64]MEC4738620.1 hypothetical protein [Shewanella sp. E94]WBJ93835.1 hypothetical protein HWQ47_18140 [Shewanella sp. MTB7]